LQKCKCFLCSQKTDRTSLIVETTAPQGMHPLANAYLWRSFRLILELGFGLYSRRIALLRSLGLRGTESTLDIGCGTGEFSVVTSGTYLGVDMNPQYVQSAHRFHPGKEFLCADVTRLVSTGRSFEVGLLVDVLHHLPGEEIIRLFATLAEILTQRIYVIDPVTQSPSNRLGRWIISKDRGRFVRPKSELLSLLEGAMEVLTVHDTRLMLIEGICVTGKPRRL